ncbi:thiamine pyrophosphate-dependent enzyme [Aquiluna sp.]|nr:thiamine pyrophosphate-dependent enzyme [Aquiluna sp.]
MPAESNIISPAPSLIRQLILQAAESSGEPTHLGGSLSIVEILSVLYGKVLSDSDSDPVNPNSDVFILSKGHAYLGLLATFTAMHLLPETELMLYQSEGSAFGAHPIRHQLPQVVSSNGSLGHGLGVGAGIAFHKKRSNGRGRVFVLMGDGECSEGSVFEAALLAPQIELHNLVALIDCNSFGNDGLLAYGKVEKVSRSFEAFGWEVLSVDGHSEPQLEAALNRRGSCPRLILATTKKGKGIPDLEGSNDTHHMSFKR